MMFRKALIFVVALVGVEVGFLWKTTSVPSTPTVPQVEEQQKSVRKPQISVRTPPYLPYDKIGDQLTEWQKQAPDLVETGTYGESTRNKPLRYLRIHPTPRVLFLPDLLGRYHAKASKKVLLTSCIHGNEPLATSTMMAIAGNLLGSYGEDSEVTRLLDGRDVYFIPVVCPDSYPNSRECDGVDPNRDFPGPNDPDHKSIKPVKELQEFFQKHGFKAVISGHTSGRMWLMPYGDRNQKCPDDAAFVRIISEMQKSSGYRRLRACEVYGRPITGSELDWYYKNSSFGIVAEFGKTQSIPSQDEIDVEFKKTYSAIKYFIKEAPEVELHPE